MRAQVDGPYIRDEVETIPPGDMEKLQVESLRAGIDRVRGDDPGVVRSRRRLARRRERPQDRRVAPHAVLGADVDRVAHDARHVLGAHQLVAGGAGQDNVP